jgi:LysM repeat protein
MNTPNPLLPQGTLPPRGRSTLFFKILMIFAVHIVVLGGILMVGCNPAKDKAKTDLNTEVGGGPASSSPMSATPTDLAPPASTAATPPSPSLPGGNNATAPMAALPATTSPVLPAAPATTSSVPTPAATGASVYVIAAGDLLSTIAKKNGVSLKALEEANPGIDAKKLQIGHKLQIPASVAATTPEAPKATESTAAVSGDASIYVVKTGDNLAKIAKAHGTTVKTLEALNDMKTSAIQAGKKLKVPVMKMASADAAPAPSATPAAPAATPAMPASPVRAN